MAPMLTAAQHFKNPCLLFTPAEDSPYVLDATSISGDLQLLRLQPRRDAADESPELTVFLNQRTSLPHSVRLTDPAETKVIFILSHTPNNEWRLDRVPK